MRAELLGSNIELGVLLTDPYKGNELELSRQGGGRRWDMSYNYAFILMYKLKVELRLETFPLFEQPPAKILNILTHYYCHQVTHIQLYIFPTKLNKLNTTKASGITRQSHPLRFNVWE